MHALGPTLDEQGGREPPHDDRVEAAIPSHEIRVGKAGSGEPAKRPRRAQGSRRPAREPGKTLATAASGRAKVGTEQPSIAIASASNAIPQVSERICLDLLTARGGRPLVTHRIEPPMNGHREHARVLARAIVVDGGGALARRASAHETPARRSANAPTQASCDSSSPALASNERTASICSVLAAMRGASDGELLVAEAKGVGGAALNQRQRLHGLDRGARIDRALDVADAKQHAPIGIGDGDGAAWQLSTRLPRITSTRIGLSCTASSYRHCSGGRLRSRAFPARVVRPSAGMISMGTPGSCFDARMTREVLTLATFGAAVSSWMMKS